LASFRGKITREKRTGKKMGYKKALANLSYDGIEAAVEAADRVHRILMRSIIAAIIVSLGLNFTGYKFFNILLLIALNTFFFYICRRPSVYAGTYVVGKIAKKVVKDVDLFRLWLDKSNAAIFLSSFYLLVVGIFRFNFTYAVIIIAALLVLYNRKKRYNVSSKFLQLFSGILPAVVIIICLILAVPREAYAKYIGFDLAGMLRVSDTEKIISDTNIKLEKVKGKRDQIELKKAQDELDQLSNNPRALEDPASEEKIQRIQNRIKAIEEKPEYRSNPGKVKGVFSSKSSNVSKQPADQAIVYQPGTYTFSLKAGEKTDRWIMFPQGVVINYDVSSEDNKFQLLYDDGEVVSIWTANSLPNKARDKFKMIAVTDQPKITMKVVNGQLSAITQ